MPSNIGFFLPLLFLSLWYVLYEFDFNEAVIEREGKSDRNKKKLENYEKLQNITEHKRVSKRASSRAREREKKNKRRDQEEFVSVCVLDSVLFRVVLKSIYISIYQYFTLVSFFFFFIHTLSCFQIGSGRIE